jgi:histidyl-tRNA synthetase
MPEQPNVAPVRGMRDLLPAECELRDWAVGRILDTYRRFGFARIETPALEHLALLTGGQGGENEKLIYKVLKRGEKLDLAGAQSEDDLADEGLRFDLTVPLARYFAANQGTLPQPFKAIQIGPVWRAERPQKGRFRQFTQCDIDVLGEAGEIAEVELILATTEALAALGLSGFTVRVNDRRLLRALADGLDVRDEAQQERLFIALDKLDKVGAAGVLAEVASLELGAAAQARLGELLAIGSGAETALAFLERDAALFEHTARMRLLLGAVEPLLGSRGRVEFDPTLVRGMGYYTGPIFEVSMEGAPGSIAGGGRYDKMIGRMLGREVPACGFSIGFERVIGLLMERGAQPAKAGTRFALLHEPGTDSLQRVMAEAATRRAAVEGNSVAVFAKRKKLGKQLDELEKAGFDCVLTLPAGNGPPEEKWLGGGAGR